MGCELERVSWYWNKATGLAECFPLRYSHMQDWVREALPGSRSTCISVSSAWSISSSRSLRRISLYSGYSHSFPARRSQFAIVCLLSFIPSLMNESSWRYNGHSLHVFLCHDVCYRRRGGSASLYHWSRNLCLFYQYMRVFFLASAAAVYSLGMDHDLYAGWDDIYLASFIVSYKMHFTAAFRT